MSQIKRNPPAPAGGQTKIFSVRSTQYADKRCLWYPNHDCNLRAMTTVSNGARPYPKVSTLGSYPGRASSLLYCPLGAVTRLSAGGGALPVIMSIIGPREPHDYRNYNLLVRGINSSPKTKNGTAQCKPPQQRTICGHFWHPRYQAK